MFGSLLAFTQEKYSKEEAVKDIDFLTKKMNQIHPGLYRYQTEENYSSQIKIIKESIKDSISYLDFFNAISPLIYEVKDLHTSFSHSKSYKRGNDKRLPFAINQLDGKNIIQYNASSDTTLTIGMELMEIDGRPIEEIKDYLKENIGTDNGNIAAKKHYATKILHAYYPKFYQLGDSVSILAKGSDSLVYFRLKTLSKKEFGVNIATKYQTKIRKNLTYSVIDSTLSLAKINITSFVSQSSPLDVFQSKFGKELKKNFKKVRKDNVQNLVLDFRGNGGGYIPNVSKLMKYVATEPFKMIDTMGLKRSAYYKVFPIQRIMPPLMAPLFFNKKDKVFRYRANSNPPKRKPKSKAYDGNLYVFMDAASYSATAFSICLLKDMGKAQFIGDIPGGANWGSHAGSWNKLKLPNSKIQIRIPQYRIVHTRLHKTHNNFFVQPDIKVEYSIKDFNENVDSYERVLKEHLKAE
jgi:hypothetical protein